MAVTSAHPSCLMSICRYRTCFYIGTRHGTLARTWSKGRAVPWWHRKYEKPPIRERLHSKTIYKGNLALQSKTATSSAIALSTTRGPNTNSLSEKPSKGTQPALSSSLREETQMDAASNTANLSGLIRQYLTEKEIVAQRAKGRKIMDSKFCSGDGKIVSITDTGYMEDNEYEPKAPGEHYKCLEEFALSVDDTWERHCIFNGDEDDPEMLSVILEMLANRNQGGMIIRQSWNQRRDRSKDGNKLRWTDMIMSSFCDAARTTEPCKNLRYVVRDNVLDFDTTDSCGVVLNTALAIKEAFRMLNAPTTKTLRLDHRSTKTDEIAMFELLAAQTHVARVYQMIQSFPIELAGKDVSAIHLQHKQHSTGCGRYNIIVELGQNGREEV